MARFSEKLLSSNFNNCWTIKEWPLSHPIGGEKASLPSTRSYINPVKCCLQSCSLGQSKGTESPLKSLGACKGQFSWGSRGANNYHQEEKCVQGKMNDNYLPAHRMSCKGQIGVSQVKRVRRQRHFKKGPNCMTVKGQDGV